jgi:hypothetical protein
LILKRFGQVLVLDDSNCKSSFAPPSIIRNGTMEQLKVLGEDNFNDGHDQFWFSFGEEKLIVP